MKLRIATLLALSFLAACSSDPAATCGNVEVDGTSYCVYQNAITETGYTCPEDMPNMYRDDDFDLVACSDDDERPDFEAIDRELEQDGEPDNSLSADMGPSGFADFGLPPGCEDFDSDGYGVGETGECEKCQLEGDCRADCDDNDAARNPGAVEVCDGLDNSCGGQIDEACDCSAVALDQCDSFADCAVASGALYDAMNDCHTWTPIYCESVAENNCARSASAWTDESGACLGALEGCGAPSGWTEHVNGTPQCPIATEPVACD